MIQIEVDQRQLIEVKKSFNRLSIKTQDKVLPKVLRKVARPVNMAMKAEAPKSVKGSTSTKYSSRTHPAGYLKASIGIIASRRGGKYPTVWVRPRHKGKWDPWYEHLPQMRHRIRTGSEYTERVTTFVDNAWNKTKSQVQATLRSDLARLIQAEINKL